MTMPSSWVDKIFQKLTLTYGRDFLGRWEGIPLDEVKADWAHELDGYQNAAHSIHYALTHLPAKAPTVIEFRSLCRLSPAKEAPRLDAPKASPELVRKCIAEARALLTRAKA